MALGSAASAAESSTPVCRRAKTIGQDQRPVGVVRAASSRQSSWRVQKLVLAEEPEPRKASSASAVPWPASPSATNSAAICSTPTPRAAGAVASGAASLSGRCTVIVTPRRRRMQVRLREARRRQVLRARLCTGPAASHLVLPVGVDERRRVSANLGTTEEQPATILPRLRVARPLTCGGTRQRSSRSRICVRGLALSATCGPALSALLHGAVIKGDGQQRMSGAAGHRLPRTSLALTGGRPR